MLLCLSRITEFANHNLVTCMHTLFLTACRWLWRQVLSGQKRRSLHELKRGQSLHHQSSVSSQKFGTLTLFCFSAAWRNGAAHGSTCWAGGSSSLSPEKRGAGWCPSQGRCSAYNFFCFLLLKNIAEAGEQRKSNFVFIWAVGSTLSTPETVPKPVMYRMCAVGWHRLVSQSLALSPC